MQRDADSQLSFISLRCRFPDPTRSPLPADPSPASLPASYQPAGRPAGPAALDYLQCQPPGPLHQLPAGEGLRGPRSLAGCAGGWLNSLQLARLRSSSSLFKRWPRGLGHRLNFCWNVPWVHLWSHCSEVPPSSSGRRQTGGVNSDLRVPPLPSPPDQVSLPKGVLKAKRRQATCHLSERWPLDQKRRFSSDTQGILGEKRPRGAPTSGPQGALERAESNDRDHLPAGGWGTGSGQRLRPSPPCICRAEGASQSGLDPPLRSAHTTVPEIRHARQKCATSLRLNFKQRADSRLAAMVTSGHALLWEPEETGDQG